MSTNYSKPGPSKTKAAVIGALIGIPVPFIGPVIGAIAGVGYSIYKAKQRP